MFEIIKGHVLPMSGCVAYWVQVLLSNSLFDLTTFGAVGVTEDAAMVFVVGEFCKLKKAQKTRIYFFASIKKLKKHGFNFLQA